MSSEPRGLRLNNPGNIRISDTPWHGKIAPSSDSDFEQFDTSENGIRAMARIVIEYHLKYSLSTIADIITRWAPPSENDTGAYINAVVTDTGIAEDKDLNFTDREEISTLVKAIIHHEQGQQPYADDVIDAGVNSAFS